MTPATRLMVSRLREVAARGTGPDEAAVEIGSSRAYLIAFAIRHKIKFARPSKARPTISNANAVLKAPFKERNDQIAVMFRQGLTLEEIGAQHGITRERARQILRDHYGLRGDDGGACVRSALARAARLNRTEARYQRKHGCSRAQYKQILRAGGTRGYTELKRNAARDNIKLELTLWQWWGLWQESGRWKDRGRGRGYWMFRLRSDAPLSIDNYCIAPGDEAMSLMHQAEPGRFARGSVTTP